MPLTKLKRLAKGSFRKCCRAIRIVSYSILSTNDNVIGRPKRNQPILCGGRGSIKFGNNVNIGVGSSPDFWSSYCYLESRSSDSSIIIGENTSINNGFSAIAEKCSIQIGRGCLIGHKVVVFDSNFHSLDPKTRHSGGAVAVGDVVICDNVFIGSRVTILKNTRIGSGSVVGAGSVVSGDYPENCLIAGNPAVVVRQL